VFVKTNGDARPEMFPCEARGLAWLAEPQVLRVPKVLACSPVQGDGPRYLVLERIDATVGRAPDYDEQLGRGLAHVHKAGAPGFGLHEANFIGTIPQPNDPCESWPDFYIRRRLEPLVQAAVDDEQAPVAWINIFKRLFHRMEQLAGPPEPPARLHGDLWSGNLLSDDRGAPCVIDPAVYGGHREIDLAMMRLFGGVSARAFAAYDEAFPLAAGHHDRVRLYQLYPLLVHTRLFGGGYARAVEEAALAYL
jgi:fructosamine-3-kinase